ncbi:heme chaperone HemW [Impatiens glandulifera]|uniref:heme chaperone HemW n=1 Tax=Impatiens glandulifera TaxID=253017 RepID=UPI001FB0C7B8|nr:heme chaperone HemW [Impatiens glandulifera]
MQMLKSSFSFASFLSNPSHFRPLRLIHTKPTSQIQHPPTVRQNATPNLHNLAPHNLPPTSLYIHLPFCRKRCHYCDFTIVALGSSSSTQHDNDPRITDYINLLIREITATIDQSNVPLQTVFFGGGTPSLVSPKLISIVLDKLNSKFGLCSDAEISMEMDPGTFDDKKMKQLVDLGVNRVSLGVQAFQDELLKACGRAHGVNEVYDAIEIVKGSGIKNFSMDLISSLPHQTIQQWEESLQFTIEANPNHVSVYDLQVEQGTKFDTLYKPGEFPLPSENQSAELYKIASKMLSNAGYNHYEISSYSKNGFECKHNITYWKNLPFYGFGLGSTGYVGGLRFSRPKRMRQYVSFVEDLENGVVNPHEERGIDGRDLAMDVVMLSLRTARGLELESFLETFGWELVGKLFEAFEPYVESGHVICLDRNRRTVGIEELRNLEVKEDVVAFVRLSDPDGFLLSNELISIAFGVIAP